MSTPPTRLVGLIDESFRVVRGGHYVLAAAVVPQADLDDVRSALRAVVPASIVHFRWAKEQDVLREKALTAIEALEVPFVVVVTTPVEARRQERARARCLERLAWELSERSTGHLLIESRADQDVRDRRVLAGLQRRRVISGSMTYAFGTKADPALWIPDAVAGAVMAQRCEGVGRFATQLTRVAVVDVTAI